MERLQNANSALRLGIALILVVATTAAQTPPLVIAKQGYFFVGGKYFEAQDGRFMSGQMYVEFQIPRKVTHRYPIVMFSGGGRSGLRLCRNSRWTRRVDAVLSTPRVRGLCPRPALSRSIGLSAGSRSAIT